MIAKPKSTSLSWKENSELIDIWQLIWQLKHQNEKSFMVLNMPYPIFGRLDFYFIAKSMKDYAKETSIRFGLNQYS